VTVLLDLDSTDTLARNKTVGNSREPPAFTFFGCIDGEADIARSYDMHKSGSPPGAASFLLRFLRLFAAISLWLVTSLL
jgi:hypothetical protein